MRPLGSAAAATRPRFPLCSGIPAWNLPALNAPKLLNPELTHLLAHLLTHPTSPTARSLSVAPNLSALCAEDIRADLAQMDRSLQLTRHYAASLHGHLNHPQPHSQQNAHYSPPTPRNFKRQGGMHSAGWRPPTPSTGYPREN